MGIFKRGKGEENLDIGERERRGGVGLKPMQLLSQASPTQAIHHMHNNTRTRHEITRTQCNNKSTWHVMECMHAKEEKIIR